MILSLITWKLLFNYLHIKFFMIYNISANSNICQLLDPSDLIPRDIISIDCHKSLLLLTCIYSRKRVVSEFSMSFIFRCQQKPICCRYSGVICAVCKWAFFLHKYDGFPKCLRYCQTKAIQASAFTLIPSGIFLEPATITSHIMIPTPPC